MLNREYKCASTVIKTNNKNDNDNYGEDRTKKEQVHNKSQVKKDNRKRTQKRNYQNIRIGKKQRNQAQSIPKH